MRNISDVEDFIRWRDLAKLTSDNINQYVQNSPDLRRAISQRYQTCAAHLLSLEIKFNSLIRVGGNLQEPQSSTSRGDFQEVDGEGVV